MVRAALRQLGVAPGSLEDATQDVFVVLFRRASRFDASRSVKNWLWGIARGVASTYRRSDRRRHRLHAALPAERGVARVTVPERTVAEGEAAQILDRFLRTLDADKCAVFVLADVEGRSGAEISRMLDVNVNTVYARLRAARRHFASAVAPHDDTSARPLFASWLPAAWLPGAWIPRAATLAAGVGALATAISLPSDPEAAADVGPAIAQAVIPWEAPTTRAPDSTPRIRHTLAAAVVSTPPPSPAVLEIELPAEEDDVDIVILATAPAPARRSRVARPVEVAPPPEPPPEIETDVAPVVPWGERIVARPPSSRPRPSLVAARHDFVDELGYLAQGL
jgi:RNA polymerase sigma-70 factor (ECF subfamily)